MKAETAERIYQVGLTQGEIKLIEELVNAHRKPIRDKATAGDDAAHTQAQGLWELQQRLLRSYG